MQVLIVDDSKVSLKVLSNMLNKWGIVVDTAENGIAAVREVQMNDFDLIFMDIQMEKLDGYKAADTIRNLKLSRSSKTPIIALTASIKPDIIEKIMKAGMDGYLLKTFNQQEIHNIIKQYSGNNPLTNSPKKQPKLNK